MKRTKVFLILALFLFVVSSPAYSLQLLDFSELRKVCAQGTVEIEIDNMMIDAMPGTMIYTDNDGSGNGVSASVNVVGFRTVQTFNAIVDDTNRNGLLKASYGDRDLLGDHAIESSEDAKNLSISIVDELPLMTAIERFNNPGSVSRGRSASKAGNEEKSAVSPVSGILVNLPTIEMTYTGGTHQLVFKQEGAINNDKFYFYHEKSGMGISAILGGKVEVAAR